MLGSFAPTQYTLNKNPNYWAGRADRAVQGRVPGAGDQPGHQPARRQQRPVRLVLHVPAGRAEDLRRPRPGAQHLLVPAGRHDRPVPEPDEGAEQQRQTSARASRRRWTGRRSRRRRSTATCSRPACPGSSCRTCRSGWTRACPTRALVSQNTTAAMAAFAKAGYTHARRQADRRQRNAGQPDDRAAEQLQRLGRGGHRGQERADGGRHQGQPGPAAVRAVLSARSRPAPSTPRSAASAAPAARTPTSTTR